MNNEYKEQELNREKAEKAANDLIDSLIKANPQFKELICKDILQLMIIKSADNYEIKNFLNNNIEFRSFVNSMGLYS